MGDDHKIDKIEAMLYDAAQRKEECHTPSESWQQNLMKDIHALEFQRSNSNSDVLVPAFIKRFAWGSLSLAIILLIMFGATYNTLFQSSQDRLASDVENWLTDNTTYDNLLYIAKNGK
jgi:hypothetical protein